MYDNVVNDLRHCVESPNRRGCAEGCTVGKAHPLNYWCIPALMTQAADAIEELSKRVNESIPKADAEIIIAEVAKPRWIPVTKLPPEGETYGDTTFSVEVLGTEGFTYRKAYYNFKYKVWIDGNEENEWPSITHWMPLPEPPMEETE